MPYRRKDFSSLRLQRFLWLSWQRGHAQHSNSNYGDGGQEGGEENVPTVGSFPFPPCILSELPAYGKVLPTCRVDLPPLVSAF